MFLNNKVGPDPDRTEPTRGMEPNRTNLNRLGLVRFGSSSQFFGTKEIGSILSPARNRIEPSHAHPYEHMSSVSMSIGAWRAKTELGLTEHNFEP